VEVSVAEPCLPRFVAGPPLGRPIRRRSTARREQGVCGRASPPGSWARPGGRRLGDRHRRRRRQGPGHPHRARRRDGGGAVAGYPSGDLPARASWGRTPRTSPQGYRIEHLGPVQRGLVISDIEAAGRRSCSCTDGRTTGRCSRCSAFGLRRRGFGHMTTMNYSILTGDVRVAAAQLAEEIEAIVAETGYERIHVVGHSMGGLIARYYVTRLGRGRAGPHAGAPWAAPPRDLPGVRVEQPDHAAAASRESADAGAGAAGRELPHPLPLLLVRHRPVDVPPALGRPWSTPIST
jgi:hypothetical protein